MRVVIVMPSGLLPVDEVTSRCGRSISRNVCVSRNSVSRIRAPDGGLLAADPQVDLDLDDAGLLVEDAEPDLLLLGVGVGVEDLLGRRGEQPRHPQLEGVGVVVMSVISVPF